MRRTRPVEVEIPSYGVAVYESIHDPEFEMPFRIDPFDKLILVVRGVVRAEEVENDVSVDASLGSVLFIPHGVRHQVEDLQPSTLFLMCIAADFEQDWSEVRGLVDEIGKRICVWDRLSFQTTLVPLWRRLLSERSSTDIGSEIMIRAEVQRFLVRLARSPTQQKAGIGARIQTLVSEMERTSFEPWSVDEAAECVGVSRRQFTKLFRLETGLSFVSVLTGFRIDRAKVLLQSGGYTAAGAAYAAGFGDVAHFYRVFKKHEGRTPGDWLRLSSIRSDG